MSMISRIKNALAENGIREWIISATKTDSSEYFFVKKKLDTRRAKSVEKYGVTVFVSADGKKGTTTVTVTPGTPSAEISRIIKDAAFAASFAMNPGYELPDPVRSKRRPGASAELLGGAEKIMIDALFAPDTAKDAFINSA